MTTHKNIYDALSAAQSEMGKALKDATNPHFKSKYADLASVMDACMPSLTKNGIALTQPFVSSDFGQAVKTVLTHGASETYVECAVPVLLGKQDMQGLGSAFTYARRYGLMAMAGIAPDDDDGNAAAAAAPKQNKARESLQDAWRDAVLDSLPDNPTDAQKAEGFALAIIKDFDGKGEKALDNAWDRRKALIASLEGRFPALFEKVQDAFLARQNEILEAKSKAEGNSMEAAQ